MDLIYDVAISRVLIALRTLSEILVSFRGVAYIRDRRQLWTTDGVTKLTLRKEAL